MDEIRLCHLGALDQVLLPDQVEELNRSEVLIVPVGGHGVLDSAAAAEVVSLLEPRIVVPMLFRTELSNAALDPLDRFLKEMGVAEAQPVPRINVTRTSLPIETSVTVLDYRR
jgi:L-ascorbate metabolism protein UlaG (beta-lactamase superfamily)